MTRVSASDPPVSGSDELPARVVVGVDGSEHSIAALRWAARYAAIMRLPLVVVTAWPFPEEPAPLGIEISVPWQEELIHRARAALDEIADECVPTTEGAQVETRVVPGHPAQVLLDETSPDDLLVVGSCGRGAVEKLMFGSVSDRCVRHPRCPVVVVR